MGKTLAIINNKAKRTKAELEQQLEAKTKEAKNFRNVLEGLEFEHLDELALCDEDTHLLGEATARLIRHFIDKARRYELRLNQALDALQKYSETEAEQLRTEQGVAADISSYLKILQ